VHRSTVFGSEKSLGAWELAISIGSKPRSLSGASELGKWLDKEERTTSVQNEQRGIQHRIKYLQARDGCLNHEGKFMLQQKD
jgi:hypothetical protein